MAEPLDSGSHRGWATFIVVACLLVVAGVFLNRLPVGIHSFEVRDIDQHPYGKRSGADIRESWEAERRRESARYTDADLQRMVERLFVQPDPDRANFDGLLYAGVRALPFLLKALDDPRTRTAVFIGGSITDNSPFERICALLRSFRPAEAAAPVAGYLDNPNPSFRRQAALLLATIGSRKCLEPVKRALADKDQELREYALIGLTSETKGKARNGEFLSVVFPALIPLLNAEKYSPETPAKAMMAVDPGRAVPVLESARYFSVQNPQLSEVLQALNRPGVKVPRNILLPLLAKLEPRAAKDSAEQWAYAAGLSLYANNPDDHANSKFQTLIDSPSAVIASAAVEGLQTLAGIQVDVIWDIYDRRGFAAMTQPQQFCFAVSLYRDEVNNGGHKQYFYNDDSDLYEVAIEGMRAMGATSQASILSDASLAFAPAKPAPTQEGRRRQLEGLKDFTFETEDQRFYKLEEEPGQRLDVLMALYALKHQSDFAFALRTDAGRASEGDAAKNP